MMMMCVTHYVTKLPPIVKTAKEKLAIDTGMLFWVSVIPPIAKSIAKRIHRARVTMSRPA